MSEEITVTVKGQFTVLELAGMIMFIRGLDQDARHWEMFIDDPGKRKLGEAEELLRELVPEVPGCETAFSVHREQ